MSRHLRTPFAKLINELGRPISLTALRRYSQRANFTNQHTQLANFRDEMEEQSK